MEGQRRNAEHLSTDGDNDDLPDQDDEQNEQETLTLLEVEGRLSGEISASVEHIPELEHHEEREDVALLEIGEAGARTELEISQSGERSHIGILADID